MKKEKSIFLFFLNKSVQNFYTNSMEIEKASQEKDSIGKVTGFFLFRNLINSYNEDKSLPDDQRKMVKKYGTTSIILSTIAILISLSCLISVISNIQFFGFSYILMLIIFILCGVVLTLLLSIYSFVFAVMQVRLNRRSSGIIGIVLSILTIVSSFLLVFFLIT